jgi:DNA-binding transcriptional LysR family regulator
MEWLRAVELFVHVVHEGSLSAAARKCGVSIATVSRVLQSLEDDVGGRLIDRTSRKLSLTEAGETYFGQVEQILHEIQKANESVARLHVNPRGMIRVHSRLLVGNLFIAPAMPGFLQRYPEITVDLQFSNHPVDLAAQNVDVDIRVGKLADSSLVARKLAGATRLLCAAPSYLRTAPPLLNPADLATHNCLYYRTNLGRSVWRLLDRTGAVHEVAVTGSLKSDNAQAIITAGLAGIGIIIAPDWAIGDHVAAGRLIPLLPDHQVSQEDFDTGIYAVFRHASQIPSKVRVYIDYIAAYFKARVPEQARRDGPPPG